jgi:DNA-binding MurR/RpiR family transcriptional regulator
MKSQVPATSNASPDVGFAQSALGQGLLRVLAEGSASNRTIADYLLRNQMRVTALGIEELAEACAVSTATISRFARDIGFKNYAAMRSAIAETLQAVLQPVDKLRNNIARHTRTATPAVESLDYAGANIAASAQALDARELERVVSRLTGARSVYVLGFGLSVHLAGMLALHLQPFCPQVVEVAAQGGTEVAAGHLANITSKDVLVVISFPRYALDVVRLAQFARDHGATLVAITDSPASPLAELSHHVLYAHSTHPVLPSSASAALAVIESLVVSLMVSNKANVAKAARLTDAISAYLVGVEPVSSSSSKDGARKRRSDKKT